MRNKLFLEVKCSSCAGIYKISLKSIDLFLYDENNISSLLMENGWGSIGEKKVCNRCLEAMNRVLPKSLIPLRVTEGESKSTLLKMKLV